MGDHLQGRTLGQFLDRLDQEGCLPKTILYNLNPSDNYLIATMLGNFQVKAPLLGGDGWVGDSLLKVAGNALDGSYFSCHFSADDKAESTQSFVKKYKAKYGAAPDDMAALGYDSAMILADAIKRAGGTDGPKLRDAIAATKEHKGITGVITLDEKRNASKSAVILTIGGGGFKFEQTVAP